MECARVFVLVSHSYVVYKQLPRLTGCDNTYHLVYYHNRAKGGELFRLIAQEPLSEEQAREVTFQILDAVSHLHDHGIVHLDLKVGRLYTNL